MHSREMESRLAMLAINIKSKNPNNNVFVFFLCRVLLLISADGLR